MEELPPRIFPIDSAVTDTNARKIDLINEQDGNTDFVPPSSSKNVKLSCSKTDSNIEDPVASEMNVEDPAVTENVETCAVITEQAHNFECIRTESSELQELRDESCDMSPSVQKPLICVEGEPGQDTDPEQVKNCELNKNVEVTNYNEVEETSEECTKMETEQVLSSSTLEYKFENACQITGAWREFKNKDGTCMKGCKWSPDGTCILTNSDDNKLRVFDLPRELHCQESWQKGRTLPELEPALRVVEGGLIYDYCWYPLMSSWNPLSCCMVTTSKDSPIHLWDAFTGTLRCTYRAYNAVDEVEAAHSVTFSPSGEKLYCGFKNALRIFDINNPGRQCIVRNLKQKSLPTPSQTGIISCICVNPAMPDIYALGSYTRSVGLYSEPEGTLLCLLKGHAGGITHLQFSPDGTKLLSGGRKDSEVICWDIRNPGQILFIVQRTVTTNQRIYFDITPDSRFFVSGNTNGRVSVWDTAQGLSNSATGEPTLALYTTIPAHGDCVNGVSIHQHYPILATASGQRHIPCSDSDSDSSIEETYDTSLKLWWVGSIASAS